VSIHARPDQDDRESDVHIPSRVGSRSGLATSMTIINTVNFRQRGCIPPPKGTRTSFCRTGESVSRRQRDGTLTPPVFPSSTLSSDIEDVFYTPPSSPIMAPVATLKFNIPPPRFTLPLVETQADEDDEEEEGLPMNTPSKRAFGLNHMSRFFKVSHLGYTRLPLPSC
jgi:hypothetical protein